MENGSEKIKSDLYSLGVMPGDVILMHSSFKNVGQNLSPTEFLQAIIDYLTPQGTLLLPALSYEYVDAEHPLFDVAATEPCVGLLPRTFFHMPGVKRSLHPTHSVCAYGKYADVITARHEYDDTPVGANSPYMRLPSYGGKLLMLGDVLHATTFMHGVEEIIGTPFTLQNFKTRYVIRDYNGKETEHLMYRHDFKGWKQVYTRVADILGYPDIREGFIGGAHSHLIDTAALLYFAQKKMRQDVLYFVDDCRE